MLNSLKEEVYRARHGRLCLLAALSTYWPRPYTDWVIEVLHHKELNKTHCVIVISIPLIKSRRIRCLTLQKDEFHQAGYGFVWLLASLSKYALTKSLHLTNYRKFTPLQAPKPPCVIVISIPLIKSRRMRCLTLQKRRSSSGQMRLLMHFGFAIHVLTMPVHRLSYRNFTT